jgi:nicotinate dehydrogenase subunit A
MVTLHVNGTTHQIDADPSTPLLYILRNDLGLNGAKFGCGLGQCGACTVMVDHQAIYSCLTPIIALENRSITTLEGLGTLEEPWPLQRAFMTEQAAQCGYCIAGMIMRAQVLVDNARDPSDEDIREHMQPNLCRCGTHMRILRAVRRAIDAKKSANASGATEEADR